MRFNFKFDKKVWLILKLWYYFILLGIKMHYVCKINFTFKNIHYIIKIKTRLKQKLKIIVIWSNMQMCDSNSFNTSYRFSSNFKLIMITYKCSKSKYCLFRNHGTKNPVSNVEDRLHPFLIIFRFSNLIMDSQSL